MWCCSLWSPSNIAQCEMYSKSKYLAVDSVSRYCCCCRRCRHHYRHSFTWFTIVYYWPLRLLLMLCLFLLLLYVLLWHGLAWLGMKCLLSLTYVPQSICTLCALIVFNRSSSYNIDMAWEVNSTATKSTGSLMSLLLLFRCCFIFISQFEMRLCFQYK